MPFSLEPYLTGKAAKRSDSLNGLNPTFAQVLEKLYDSVSDETRRQMLITSGYRSWAYQKELYDNAIKTLGSANIPGKQVAHPDRGNHVGGWAADINSKMTDKARAELLAKARELGLEFPVPGEPWHIQLTPKAKEAALREAAYRATPMGRYDYVGDSKPRSYEATSPRPLTVSLPDGTQLPVPQITATQLGRAERPPLDAPFSALDNYAHNLPESHRGMQRKAPGFSSRFAPIQSDHFEKPTQESPFTPLDAWDRAGIVKADRFEKPHDSGFEDLSGATPLGGRGVFTPIDDPEDFQWDTAPQQQTSHAAGPANWLPGELDEETLRAQRLRAMQLLFER